MLSMLREPASSGLMTTKIWVVELIADRNERRFILEVEIRIMDKTTTSHKSSEDVAGEKERRIANISAKVHLFCFLYSDSMKNNRGRVD